MNQIKAILKIALIFMIMLGANAAKADEVLYHTVSVHTQGGFNGLNPGLGYCLEYETCVGGYYNSYKKPTFYVSQGFTHPSGVGVVFGVGTGYQECSENTITVLAAVSYSHRLSEDTGFKILAIPPVSKDTAGAVHFILTKLVANLF